MKRLKNIYALTIMLAALLTAGCKDESWNHDGPGEKYGVLDTKSIAYEVSGEAGEGRSSGNDEFVVEIMDGTKVVNRYNYSELPDTVVLAVGDYTVKVRTPEVYKAAWESPYFEGTQVVTIVEDEIAEVEKVECKLANIKVSAKLSTELRKKMSDDSKLTVIANHDGLLVFTLEDIDNGKAGYFEYIESSKTLVATLEGAIDGEHVSLQTAYTDLEPGQHRIIYYSVKTVNDPTGPSDPNDPEDPNNPSKPTDPTTPENPDDPNKPTDPENPDDPSKPTDPENPDDPSKPTDPENPDDPSKPTDPENPDDPNKPTDPSDPSKPTDPGATTGRIELANGLVLDVTVITQNLNMTYAGEYYDPITGIIRPGDDDPDYTPPTAKPEDPERPPVDLTDSDDPNNPTKPDVPVVPVDPVDPVDPTPDEPDDPNTPENPDVPSDPFTITTSGSIDLNRFNEVSQDENDNTEYSVHLHSEVGFESLVVDIDSETLTADILGDVGLSSSFDLANPGELEGGLKSLGFPTGNEVAGAKDVDFVITPFVPLLNIYGAAQHVFRLTMTDANGKSETIEIKFKSL